MADRTSTDAAPTSERLPQQPGEWIDRSQTVRFEFEGVRYTGYRGDTITSALCAAGVRMLGRSFKYHRPRGVYSMANHDVNAVMEDAHVTNIRADITPVTDGAQLRAVNTVGGLAKDTARFTELLSPFLPVGFYYKAFYKPRRLFPFWEKKMREMAGLGSIHKDNARVRTPKAYDWADVLVVGAGPSGLAAAIAAGEQGARVVVVDENARAGGTLGYQFGSEPNAAARLDEMLAKAKALPNVDIRTSTEAAGLYADNWVALIDATRLTKMRATSVVVAAGAFEQPAVFKNNDLPGVMLASGAQRLIARYSVRPFRRAVVLTANVDGYHAALDLHRAGVVVTVVDLRYDAERDPIAQRVLESKIPVHRHHTVIEALPVQGKLGIRAAVVCPLDQSDEPVPGQSIVVECDGIAMSVGWAPADGLINQVGGRARYSDELEQFVPDKMPKGVFAAGRVNGIYAIEDQIADGRRAGLAGASSAGKFAGQVPAPAKPQAASRSHHYPIFPHPKGKAFIDLDEDVQVKDIENAVQEGFDSVELIKRYVTLGMGPSQGKIANMNGIRALAKVRGKSIQDTGVTTSRPFYHPVPFGHLAGRSFHPHRHTAMHGQHKRLGAVFMPAGAWLRPAYYATRGGTKLSRDAAIREEVQVVRQGVGLIDVGTLGKIEVNGPDAAEFIERTYTGRFAKMKPGTTRYLLMCDESGVIVDDGVAARLADDRFYVTATTTGADAVYREMQRNAILWGLNVTLINQTGHLAAVNLAGPHSRTILSKLTSDIDVSQEAFPYLGVREGAVAGIPARVMRVGFVGELGYEVHVPSLHGAALWDRLMGEGSAFNIRPFGVEAQRILRLEKGHIIIGQDTDGLTHPHEAGVEWAVKMDKPFFIGQRSLTIVNRKPLTRSLVGFMLPTGYSGPMPKECHLVIRDGTITGRVTSVAHSPTLGRVLGMAYVAKEQSAVGTKFMIRIDGKREIEAEVVKTPFYDPDSRRQNETAPAKSGSAQPPREAAA